MAARVLQLPGEHRTTSTRTILRAVEDPVRQTLLPFPAPLLHPRAVEALLLAFRPLEED